MRLSYFVLLFGTLLTFVLAQPSCADDAPGTLGYRWFYIEQGTKSQAAVERLKTLVDTAADHGLNGIVLQASWDNILNWPDDRFVHLQEVKAHCDSRGMDLIPLMLSAGYGHGVVRQNPNLAEGMPFRGALFKVQGKQAHLVPDQPVTPQQGGFEKTKGHQCRFLSLQEEPGRKTHIDRTVAHSGRASLRFERSAKGAKRIAFDLPKPFANYVIRFWAKSSQETGVELALCIYDGKHQRKRINIPLTDEWSLAEVTVATLDRKPSAMIGLWQEGEGSAWIDDLEVIESGLANVLRRPGTPVVVKNSKTGQVYTEGDDFERIEDPDLNPVGLPHPSPSIQLTPNSKIADGDLLAVSGYVPILLRKRQPIVSMSEPEVYAIWEQIVARVQNEIAPSIWFLDMDEIRGGCTDQLSQDRGMTSGEILGDCITRQHAMIRRQNPDAEVVVWNDMLDPHHNAREHYFTVPGGFVGAWNHVPKDLIIANWNSFKTEESMAHFAAHGFRTLAAAYYDADDLEDCHDWIHHLKKTPRSVGIMYTSWENKYKLLGSFGDLVKKAAQ